MVDFGDTHWNILSAIKTKLEELESSGDLKEVTIGELKTVPPDKFPICFIIPKRDPEVWATGNELLHKLRSWIVVLVRGADPLETQEDIVKLSGKVHDKIKEDLTLGGTCENINFNERIFDYSLGKDYVLNWSVTEIDCEVEE